MQFRKYQEVHIQNIMPDLQAKFAKVILWQWCCADQEHTQHHSDVPHHVVTAKMWRTFRHTGSTAHLHKPCHHSGSSTHCYSCTYCIFPNTRQPSFATFNFQGNTYKEHICLWVIVRQQFVSYTQVSTVCRRTPFWCQVNFALIKFLPTV